MEQTLHWIFGAFLGAIIVAGVSTVVEWKIKSTRRKRIKTEMLEACRMELTESGIGDKYALLLAELKLKIKEDKLEAKVSWEPYSLAHFIKSLLPICQVLRSNPDKVATKTMESMVMPLITRKEKEIDENLTPLDRNISFWASVVCELRIAVRAAYIFDYPFIERLIFNACMDDLHSLDIDAPAYEDAISDIGKRSTNAVWLEQWVKWLMEDDVYKKMLEEDLSRFQESTDFSESFYTYYKKYHIPQVAYRLKQIAEEIATKKVKQKFSLDNNQNITNEVYLEVALAYKAFCHAYYDF